MFIAELSPRRKMFKNQWGGYANNTTGFHIPSVAIFHKIVVNISMLSVLQLTCYMYIHAQLFPLSH